MSTQNIFPELQGINWNYKKKTIWATQIQKGKTGLETRIQNYPYPLYQITLSYDFLTDSSSNYVGVVSGDVENLVAFYNSVGGAFNDFLYKDPVENSVLLQTFAVGTGTVKQFQLIRNLGGWTEPVFALNRDTIKIYVDGVLKTINTDYIVSNYGVVTFAANPLAGTVLKWSGTYYFRCRFLNDELELDSLMKSLWVGDTVEIQTVKLRAA